MLQRKSNVDINLLIERYKHLRSLNKTAQEFGMSIYRTRSLLVGKVKINNKGTQRFLCNDDFFGSNTQESFYWAGFLAADGCVSENRLIVNAAKKDKEQLEKLSKQIEFQGNILSAKWKVSSGFQINITSEQIVKDLERFNVVPRKTFCYTFPKNIIDNALVNHFIRGYFDGDGTVGMYLRKGKRTRNCSCNILGTQDFINTVAEIVKAKCNVNLSVLKTENIYMGAFSGNQNAKLFRDFLYNGSKSETCMERKKEIFWSPEIGINNRKR